jgi:serine/threonine protein kinase
MESVRTAPRSPALEEVPSQMSSASRRSIVRMKAFAPDDAAGDQANVAPRNDEAKRELSSVAAATASLTEQSSCGEEGRIPTATETATTGASTTASCATDSLNEQLDSEGNTIRVADLVFLDGILGKGAYGTVRLARRKIPQSRQMPLPFQPLSPQSKYYSRRNSFDVSFATKARRQDKSECSSSSQQPDARQLLERLATPNSGQSTLPARSYSLTRSASVPSKSELFSSDEPQTQPEAPSVPSSLLSWTASVLLTPTRAHHRTISFANNIQVPVIPFPPLPDASQPSSSALAPQNACATPKQHKRENSNLTSLSPISVFRRMDSGASGDSHTSGSGMAAVGDFLTRRVRPLRAADRTNTAPRQVDEAGAPSRQTGERIRLPHPHQRPHQQRMQVSSSISDDENDSEDEKSNSDLVAVKIFHKSFLNRQRTMERNATTRKMQIKTALMKVEREIALMKKLSHPNVVAFYDVIDSPDSDILYMVIEYMPLGEILTYQNDGTFRRVEPKPRRQVEELRRHQGRERRKGKNRKHGNSHGCLPSKKRDSSRHDAKAGRDKGEDESMLSPSVPQGFLAAFSSSRDQSYSSDDSDEDLPQSPGIQGIVDGHFDEEHAALYFVDVMHGLAYLHSHNIVHRDIKPGTFLCICSLTLSQ